MTAVDISDVVTVGDGPTATRTMSCLVCGARVIQVRPVVDGVPQPTPQTRRDDLRDLMEDLDTPDPNAGEWATRLMAAALDAVTSRRRRKGARHRDASAAGDQP